MSDNRSCREYATSPAPGQRRIAPPTVANRVSAWPNGDLVKQRADHHQGILTATDGWVVIATPANLVKAVALIQAVGHLITRAHLQKTVIGPLLLGLLHQVFEQFQTQTTPLAFRLDGDIEQMRLVHDDLDHAVANLLLAFKHHPAVVSGQAVGKDAARPRVAEGGIL